jgi:ubiquinone/menaquinone biosynthesis C-methylase UbiE
MKADGYTGHYIGFDFAPAVIEQLNTQRGQLPASVTFEVQDARNLPYEDQSYDCVIDKGTIDAMLCQDDGALCNFMCMQSSKEYAYKIGSALGCTSVLDS